MNKGLKFFASQFIRVFTLLFCVSILAFFLVSICPIDPVATNVGQAALASMSPEQIEKLHSYWGTDIPATERYISWFKDAIRGDLGVSLLYRRPVIEVIGEKLANSMLILAFAWLFSGIFGFLLGALAGLKRGSLMDKAISSFSLILASSPTFWLALIFLMVFSVQLGIFPIGLSVPIGTLAEEVTLWQKIYHGILPALTLSLLGIANIAMHTREKTIEIMSTDYILFAKARGESDFSIFRNHILRNALLPAMTLQFASISEIFGGSVLVEEVFSFPGLGQAAVRAGLGSDVPLLLGITLISAAIVFFGNLIANILYGIIDPRIRRGGISR